MTDTELNQILTDLLSLSKETEWVEFKEAKTNFDKNELGKYNSALSNEANLRGKDYGWLVFGINDGKQIVGTNFMPGNLQDIKYQIFQSTNLTFKEVYELNTTQGRVIMFQISPAQKGYPTTWKGHCFAREGESLVPLSQDKYQRILNQGEDGEWLKNSSQISIADKLNTQKVLEFLDFESYFRLLRLPLPSNFENIIERFTDEGFVTKQAGSYQITNLGGLLFARDLKNFGNLEYKAPRILTHDGNNKLSPVNKDQFLYKGYANGFQEIIDYIFTQLPEKESIGVLRTKTRTYPVIALREFLANSLIHQDFSTGTRPMIEIYTDHIEISNGGSCLFDPTRIIDHIPSSRNEILAEKMRVLNICEKRGSGVDRAIQAIEEMQLPAPKFVNQPEGFKSIIYTYKRYAELGEEEKLRACYQHVCLNYELGKPTTNESLRERFQIAEKSASIVSRL
jgi:ATP-dependent DNA helicase RecG